MSMRLHHFLIALAVSLALIALPGVGPVLTTTGHSLASESADQGEPFIKPGLIDGEAKAIDSVSRNMVSFFKLVRELKKKSKLSAEEASRLDASAQTFKKGIPDYKRNLQSFIGKLQAAGRWTSAYDSFLENQIANSDLSADIKSETLQGFRRTGGARALLTQAVSQLDETPTEIDSIVREVKAARLGKLPFASRLKNVAYSGSVSAGPPNAVLFAKGVCTFCDVSEASCFSHCPGPTKSGDTSANRRCTSGCGNIWFECLDACHGL